MIEIIIKSKNYDLNKDCFSFGKMNFSNIISFNRDRNLL